MPDTTISRYSYETTGQAFGNVIFEDVEDVITRISPDETPFQAACGTGKAKQVYHEWLTDELRAPTGTNAAVDGADATATTRTPPVRQGNYCQIIEDTFKISGTLDAEDNIGRESVSTDELKKSLAYLKTELEHLVLNNTASVAGDATTARKAKGVAGFLTTNDKSYASYAATNDFSEDKFMAMGQAAYKQGGKPGTLLVPADQARKIADWDQGGRITVNTNASEKTLTMAVMVFETPFGRVKMVIDLFIKQDNQSGTIYEPVFLLDMSMFKIAWLRRMKTEELAKVGDARKFQSLAEMTLVCKNEKASAICKKCATD